MPLFVVRLDPEAKLPTVAHQGEDLCYDLYALEDTELRVQGLPVKVHTGISAIWKKAYSVLDQDDADQYGLVIRDRSGLSSDHGVIKVAGEIDPGYRGEIVVALTPLYGSYWINAGDKIAQMRPVKLLTDSVVEVDTLPPSLRGKKGFGSSGND